MQIIIDQDTSEAIALKALAFMARDDEILASFLQISGASPDALKGGLGDRFFLAGVLEYLLSQEALLLEFCAQEKLDPHFPNLAQAILAGTDKDMYFM
jgi:hypothetical protein